MTNAPPPRAPSHDPDRPERFLRRISEIREVLDRISLQPSCIDMGWEFEVREVFVYTPDDPDPGRYPPLHQCAGFEIRTSFQRPDRDTGKIARGFGRWWHVPVGVSESGLVKSMYAAIRLNVEHELLEAFHYDGVRIFDPHHTIDDLGSAAMHHAYAHRGDT
jgi:hypothetical protein